MQRSRVIITVLTLIIACATLLSAQGGSRSIMERRMWYATPDNTTGEVRFWSVYLGLINDVPLERRIHGHGTIAVNAALNFQFLSSGYIEGNGFSNHGRVECLPTMMISNENGERRVVLDSIDYIYDFGHKVTLINGEKGKFVVSAEGYPVEPNRFVLRRYNLRRLHGEEILDNTAEEIVISAMAFSRQGIQRAVKEPLE